MADSVPGKETVSVTPEADTTRRQYSQQEVADILVKAAEAEGADPDEVLAFAYHESQFDPYASNTSGSALGLAQAKPDWAEKYGITDRFDPEQSAKALAKSLKGRSGYDAYLEHNQGKRGAGLVKAVSEDATAVFPASIRENVLNQPILKLGAKKAARKVLEETGDKDAAKAEYDRVWGQVTALGDHDLAKTLRTAQSRAFERNAAIAKGFRKAPVEGAVEAAVNPRPTFSGAGIDAAYKRAIQSLAPIAHDVSKSAPIPVVPIPNLGYGSK